MSQKVKCLLKHKQTEHEHEEMQFSMRITKRFKDPLSRQANEAMRTTGRVKNETLNSKNEFNHPPIARISVERSKKYYSGQRTPITVSVNKLLMRFGSFPVL